MLTVVQPSPVLPDAAFASIEKQLKTIDSALLVNASYSIQVTSNTDTLWEAYHSAENYNKTRPGVIKVDGDSQYRIASITKTFTVLGILYQHAAGNLSLDDSIQKYIPELAADDQQLPWKDITLRILASQLSGIPREFAQSDLLMEYGDPTKFGLPPISSKRVAPCYRDEQPATCNRTDLIRHLKKQQPVFAPNQFSTYSNVAFELLGLAIENATGMGYSEYIDQAIFQPLNMTLSSLDTPPDTHAVLPTGDNYWDSEEGVQRPTGGIYASTSDMSNYVRYVLTHFNTLATGVNWLLPASSASGVHSFYGMPWEIFRTERLLEDSTRPVTFVTKSGSLPGYYSRISVLPEYGLGVTILVSANPKLVEQLQEIVTVSLVRAAENEVWKSLEQTHGGSYVAIDEQLNSSISFSASPSGGLTVTNFISNGTDELGFVFPTFFLPLLDIGDLPWRVQLMPTLLYKNETSQQGEIWRMLVVPEEPKDKSSRPVWDDFCIANVEYVSYGGLPFNEVVFWLEDGIVELPAWRVKLKKREAGKGLVDQTHLDL